MKIFISADIEGCCGVVNWDETEKGDDYEIYRNIMTEEVNAVIRGLRNAGVDEIVVRDAHDSARNILIEKLEPNVSLIRGWSNSPVDMMDGLDESFDGVIFVGYHAPSRSDGNPLAHTQNLSRHIHMKLNDKILSEYHINTYYAMEKKVPVIMISGDKKICDIALSENNHITTVPTKEGLQGAIISLHPQNVRNNLEQASYDAIQKLKDLKFKDYAIFIPKSLELEIQYRKIELANKASFYPGATRLSSDKVIYRTNDIQDIFKFIFFCD